MKRLLLLFAMVSIFMVQARDNADYKVYGTQNFAPTNQLTLWYDMPATLANVPNKWMEYSLPLGNGQFGVTLLGGVHKDEIFFNEKTLWSGRSTDNGEYGKYECFGTIVAEIIGNEFGTTNDKSIKEYCRWLDLTSATAGVDFKSTDLATTYTRRYIVSNPDNVMVARYVATGKGKLNMRFTLHACRPGIIADTYYAGNQATFDGKLQTVSYNARMQVNNIGGNITSDADGIVITEADEIVVVLAGATDFDAYSPTYISDTEKLTDKVKNRIENASAKGWNTLYNAHIADYRPIFERMTFTLEGAENTLPTDRMILKYNTERTSGKENYALMLEQLYFAYGRYLAIASSRGVDIPSNLQGIWSNNSHPAWNGDIHSNINVQMNYWHVESTNLSELHMPFLNYIINMAVNHDEWKRYARESGQSVGWTCYTENNIFGGVGDFAHNYVIANAWYCTHLWQHYRYTLDKEFLAKAFPAMWSACRFWLERLKLDKDGTYVCPNEFSPEHGPSEDGVAHAQQLVWELFDNTLAAAKILGSQSGVSKSQLALLSSRFNKLDKGLGIETYTGEWGEEVNGVKKGNKLLREWKSSTFASGSNGHRHISHMMCMYPFAQVTPESPYFEPAVNSMRLRGDISTGWSMGWKINVWARALRGDRAHDILEQALNHSDKVDVNYQNQGGVYYNLYDCHPPFQIDGNFGATAGIVEMLMQSHSGTIAILPALPEEWQSGKVLGMKAIGDFTVDIEWESGKATCIKIVNNQGEPGKISYPGIENYLCSVNEKPKKLKSSNGALSLPDKKGTIIIFKQK